MHTQHDRTNLTRLLVREFVCALPAVPNNLLQSSSRRAYHCLTTPLRSSEFKRLLFQGHRFAASNLDSMGSIFPNDLAWHRTSNAVPHPIFLGLVSVIAFCNQLVYGPN